MNHTRSNAFRLVLFLGLGLFILGAKPVFSQTPAAGPAQNERGWGGVWQDRLTIGQAELDDGFKLAEQGKIKQALATIDEVIRQDPNNWRPYFLKAAVLVLAKRGGEALQQIDTSIALAKKSSATPSLLAELYESKARSCLDYGRPDEARQSLETAVHLQPSDPTTLNDLAWLLATSKEPRIRNGRRAVSLAQKACKIGGWSNAFTIDTLAAACAAAGNFQDAVKYQKLAIDRLEADDRKLQIQGMQERLQQYLAGRSYVVS
jgi:tetratricopeptide (TPR) repeat protein